MAFEFILSSDEIREKMFDFIKPVYKDVIDGDVNYINWTYGVYDRESGLFITYVNLEKDGAKYVLITESGNMFYTICHRYRHTITQISDELSASRDIIQEGINLYNNDKFNKCFVSSFSKKQENINTEITENMRDRCRPSIDIKCYEDAEQLFYKEEFSYYYISRRYNRNTVANYDKYMSHERMCAIRGEKYRDILDGILAYSNALSEEEYSRISKDFSEAGNLFVKGIDDICQDLTLRAIKKGYSCRLISSGYVGFIEEYIRICIKEFRDNIQSLRRILDFINKKLRNEYYKSLEFYRKELQKLIYNKVDGFQIILTTELLREQMLSFITSGNGINYGWGTSAINWTLGAYDKKSGIFLTQIYRATDGIARGSYNVYGYIVITDNGAVFKVDNYEYEKRRYELSVPQLHEVFTEKIKEGIEFYDYDYDYKSLLSEAEIKRLREIESIMEERCKLEESKNNRKW